MSGEQRIREQLEKWRQEIINLARSNRLLYFRHLKTATLELTSPSALSVIAKLSEPEGRGWGIFLPDEEETSGPPTQETLLPDSTPAASQPSSTPSDDEVVTNKSTCRQILASLSTLSRRAEQEFMDKGLWVLYLGVGILTWLDDQSEPAESPLLLVPVSLSRPNPREPYRLRRAEEDVAVNPALGVKLAEFGVELPQFEDVDVDSLNRFLDLVQERIGGRRGWSVTPRMVLGIFSFQKEVMYRDLERNEAEIIEHPMVASLALGGQQNELESHDFEPVSEERLDEVAPPEDMLSIRDADASQRQCIVAAREGQSFVMDGPPGTGKSQTIANMIAELIARGSTVLFVSEKAAALEVVQRRLRQRGLEHFALELHSHKATRREVAQALARPLLERARPGRTLSAVDQSQLVARRQALNEHALAMNELRQPLERSLHQVIGRIAELHRAPAVLLPPFGTNLSAARLAEILDSAARLGRAWGPVERGDNFLWRDPLPGTTDPARREEIRKELEDAAQSLVKLEEAARNTADEIGLPWYRAPSEVHRLARVTALLAQRPASLHEEWLVQAEIHGAERELQSVQTLCTERAGAEEKLLALCGPSWSGLHPQLGGRIEEEVARVTGILPAAVPQASATAHDMGRASAAWTAAAASLDRTGAIAQDVDRTLEVLEGNTTLEGAERIAKLAMLLGKEEPPETEWLTPAGAAAGRTALSKLRPLIERWHELHASLQDVFAESVLSLDLEGLKVRFETVHRGLGKLRGAYREDKQALGAVTRAQRVDDQILARLGDALSWKRLSEEIDRTESRHAQALGESYRGHETDFSDIEHRLDEADQVMMLTLSRGLKKEVASRLGEAFSGSELRNLGEQLAQACVRARTNLSSLPQGEGRLSRDELGRARDRCLGVAAPLAALASHLNGIDTVAGREFSLEQALEGCTLRCRVHELDAALDDRAERSAELLGAGFRTLETDWSELRSALAWAFEMREIFGGALDRRTARGLLDSDVSDGTLVSALSQWTSARDRLLARFGPERRGAVAQDLNWSLQDSSQLLGDLAEALGELDEWRSHETAQEELRILGLSSCVAELVEQRPPASDIRDAIERACLQAWVEAVMQEDSKRIRPDLRDADRDELLREFRDLDRALIEGAAARVIEACNARRPRGLVGAAAIILKEAEKKRRHMPVRKLLADTDGLALALKPCFFMSPLTVSQFLPSDLKFDVVIFDEASQVRPADAINCIYRGKRLIVAGDQKQLPPTSFFERLTQEEGDEYKEDQLEEFDSVLDLCKGSGVLRSLSLRWHYRSKHESLITYSNYSFYDGRLMTFPGARQEGDDVGVVLFPVEGVYRRGGARDNPIEAAAVADRVLHHARNHPDRTLGVVAFSEAQATTIEAELDRRRLALPELDDYFDGDRLDGFFIKNLENVQGDERDIIVFSIGYGPDEVGKLTMNFGPLNVAGGQRRLNVAITRARQRVEVVSSVQAADFREDGGSEGVRHLRRYLDFAERGIAALAQEVGTANRDVESPFEEEVARAIRSWGYEVVPQVGSAGYRVDLAVRHPSAPGRFALGIECDGAMYHSSRAARDRDRLRQEVLEGLGWKIHRIWGTSWYRDRAGQEARLRKAISDSLEAGPSASPPAREAFHVPAPEIVELGEAPSWTRPYEVASPRPPAFWIEFHEPSARGDIRRMIAEVLRVEGPVEGEIVLRRVREAWGLSRSGQRIRQAFERALGDLARSGQLRRDPAGFLWALPERELVVRAANLDDPATVRGVVEIPSEEIKLAVLRIVEDAKRVSRDELTTAVASVFGWLRRGAGITRGLEAAVDELVEEGRILSNDTGWLRPNEDHVGSAVDRA